MDPYSAEGELVNIHTAFHQAQYQSVVDFDTSSFSSTNSLPARILKLRAQCAQHDYSAVQSAISASEASKTPDLAAVKAYAGFASGDAAAAETAASLAEQHGDNLTVQLMCGAVLARAGETDKALALLGQHQGSLDAVALLVQIHLQQNRADLALKEAKSARSFAQDALLVNLAESWIGVREGGDKYQQSFYVFEELAQSPSSTSASSLIAQAVSELHLQRYPEAETALQQALELEPENADAIANAVVLNTLLGRDEEAAKLSTKLDGGDHAFAVELAEKRQAFEEACRKYSPKFEP
ncbi:hypothetical protein MBLNU459_g4146t1 [Dothideomycetes sp. NU459]